MSTKATAIGRGVSGKREVGFAELRAGSKGGSEKRTGCGIDKTDSGFDGGGSQRNSMLGGEERDGMR